MCFYPQIDGFAKNSLQRRSFYQIKHQMHSYLENAYFTTSHYLTKYLCVTSVSSYYTSSLNIRILAKIGKTNINFGSDINISDAKMNPFNTFGPDSFTYLKHIGVQIKEKKSMVRLQVFFFFFWQNTGPKKPVYELSPLKSSSSSNFPHCTEEIPPKA